MGSLDRIKSAPIGVFAWVRSDGTPGSCPVTPYVIGDEVVVTSTLAFSAKAAAVRSDPRVALLAAGVFVTGSAEVFVDETSTWFDENIRQAEIQKFPPTKSILAIPGHRCLFPWYVGRIVIRFRPDGVDLVDGGDAVTATQIVHERLRIRPLLVDPTGDLVVSSLSEGPANVLFHEEHGQMSDLRQQSRRGLVSGGVFVEERRSGSLDPGPTGTVAQLSELRSLARSAKRNRPTIKEWGAA